jgi:phage baseplate assembly protein W
MLQINIAVSGLRTFKTLIQYSTACDYCDAAGPEKCALYTVGGKDKVKERLNHIVETLKGSPIGVPARGALAPDFITYSDLRSRIASAVYTSLQYWSSLAELLVDLEYRNGSSFAMLKQQEQQVLTPPPGCHDALPYTPFCAIPPGISLEETSIAIRCTDGNFTYGMSRDEFVECAAKLRNQSWLIVGFGSLELCWMGYQPTWRFPAPFTGDTAHPMMFIWKYEGSCYTISKVRPKHLDTYADC